MNLKCNFNNPRHVSSDPIIYIANLYTVFTLHFIEFQAMAAKCASFRHGGHHAMSIYELAGMPLLPGGCV